MRFLLLIFLSFLIVPISMAQDTLVKPFSPAQCIAANPPTTDKPAVLFTNMNQEPYFESCLSSSDTSYTDIRLCTQSKMVEFVYQNLQYPEEGKAAGIEGTVFVCFYIEADGSIGEEIIVARDIGPGFGAEAIRIVELMKTTADMRWVGGRQYGKPVRVRFNLPVKFKQP